MSPPHSQAALRPVECRGVPLLVQEIVSSHPSVRENKAGEEESVSSDPMHGGTNCRNERNEVMESGWCWSEERTNAQSSAVWQHDLQLYLKQGTAEEGRLENQK